MEVLTNETFDRFYIDNQFGVVIVMSEITDEFNEILSNVENVYPNVHCAVASCDRAFQVGVPSIPGALIYWNSNIIARVMDEDIQHMVEIVRDILPMN